MSTTHQPAPFVLQSARPRRLPAAVCLLAPLVAGCGDPAALRDGDVRHYVAAKETAAPAAVPKPRQQTPGRLAVRYEAPAGWTDRGESGMRLATLLIGPPAEGHEVTVIPASGSLEANVARWLGQLDPTASPDALATRAAAALADSEAVDIEGTRATVVALYEPAAGAASGAAADGGEAILAAVIPIDETASLFVKFKGPAAIARSERDNFTRFVSSIRWKDAPR